MSQAAAGGTLPNMRKLGMFFLFAFLSFSSFLQAAPASSAVPAETIILGDSAATLPGPWQFAPGDSPWQNGVPVWAQPGFDDAQWATMDLTPKAGSVDLINGTSGFVPGWTARGYPNLDGNAWYRLRLRVTDEQNSQPLALKMPSDVDDAYQVYVNGQYLGQFGDFSARRQTLQHASALLSAAGAGAGWRNRSGGALLHVPGHAISGS